MFHWFRKSDPTRDDVPPTPPDPRDLPGVKLHQYYIYKDREYLVLFKGKMKVGESPWIDSVVYKSIKDDKVYTRDKVGFRQRFKPVERA